MLKSKSQKKNHEILLFNSISKQSLFFLYQVKQNLAIIKKNKQWQNESQKQIAKSIYKSPWINLWTTLYTIDNKNI